MYRLSNEWKSLLNPGKDPIILDSWVCALELDCRNFWSRCPRAYRSTRGDLNKY